MEFSLEFYNKILIYKIMDNIEFIKMHGLGNDFVIIDMRINNFKIDKNIISKLSNRKTGAGCDQLITINKHSSSTHDISIKIYNPDGDTAEACGNGTRCVAKLLFEEKNINELRIKSDAGILLAKKIDKNNISVNLGKFSTCWKDIPLSKNIDTLNIPMNIKEFSNGVGINIGNPHIVFFGKKIENIDLLSIGPKIENDKLFPEKINVEFVEIINSNKIKMRVWERGAGVTLACGSGACAAVYAGKIKGLLKDSVEVVLEKGSLYINIEKENAVMTGPAEISYRGFIKT